MIKKLYDKGEKIYCPHCLKPVYELTEDIYNCSPLRTYQLKGLGKKSDPKPSDSVKTNCPYCEKKFNFMVKGERVIK